MDVDGFVREFRDKLAGALDGLIRARGPELDSPRPVVLARVEDDRSDYPASQRIQRQLFADLVSTYDPERRVAPVVVGFFDRDAAAGATAESGEPSRVVAGPSHWVGEYLPPLGFIRGDDWHLDHDHLNLFGQVTQIIDADGVGRIDRMVARGFLQRSIAFIPKTNETDGKPDLWHFAVLGGEQPGIPNMPSLARTFGLDSGARSDWKALGLSARALRECNYRTLSTLDGMQQETEEMTAEERTALAKELAAAMGAVIAPLAESITKATAEYKTALVDLGTHLDEKVEKVQAKADTAADDAKKATDKADTANDEAKRAAADAEKAAAKAKAERQRSIEQRLVAIVKSGRAQPAHVSRVAATFENASDEAIEAALATLEALPVIDRNGSMPTEVKAEGQIPMLVDFEQRYTQPGMGHRLDVGEVEVMRGLMAGVMHLPVEQRKAALNRAILTHYDGAVASNALGF